MITTHDLSRFIPQKVNTVKNFTLGKVGKNKTTQQVPVKPAPTKETKPKK